MSRGTYQRTSTNWAEKAKAWGAGKNPKLPESRTKFSWENLLHFVESQGSPESFTAAAKLKTLNQDEARAVMLALAITVRDPASPEKEQVQ